MLQNGGYLCFEILIDENDDARIFIQGCSMWKLVMSRIINAKINQT